MPDPFVSICIITGGNLKLLEACLGSIRSQAEPPAYEVIVCSNGGPDVAPLVRSHFPGAQVAILKRSPLGAARNPLAARARGNWLLFLDDDVTIGPHFLEKMERIAAAHPEARVLGGPNDTPPRSSAFQVIQGAVLASIMVSGPVRRRYGPHPAGPADERFFTLCNLAVRRDAMTAFPLRLAGAEENALLAEMHDRGLLMHYDPELAAFHERRSALRPFAAQMVKYGLGRGQLTRHSLRTLRPAYAVPSAFILYAGTAALAAWINPVVLIPLLIYSAAVGATALNISWGLRRQRFGLLPTMMRAGILVVTVHLCYGLGFLQGLAGGDSATHPAAQPVWAEADPRSQA